MAVEVWANDATACAVLQPSGDTTSAASATAVSARLAALPASGGAAQPIP